MLTGTFEASGEQHRFGATLLAERIDPRPLDQLHRFGELGWDR
jgi:hypothetical protein